jgi:hypothetical protein
VRTAPEIDPATASPLPQQAAPPAPFDMCGEPADQDDRTRGQRRHRQDVRDRCIAARYIAEERSRASQLMLVTFGRMATGELRPGFGRLVSLEARLAGCSTNQSGRESSPPDNRSKSCCVQPQPTIRPGTSGGGCPCRVRRGDHCHHPRVRCTLTVSACSVTANRRGLRRAVDRLTREVASNVYLSRYAASGVPPPVSTMR